MSDFLSNLIARNFAGQPAIRPRLSSRFEAAAAEPFGEAPPPATIRTADQTSSSPASSNSFPAGQPLTSQPVTEKPAANAMVETIPMNPPPDKGESATRFPPATMTPPPSDEQIGEPGRVEFRAKKNIVAVISSPAKETLGQAVKPPSFQEAAVRPGSAARRQKPFPPAAPGPASPTIQVTIGRVDVRAIHPVAPAPKSATPASPRLSLDDYLQERRRPHDE